METICPATTPQGAVLVIHSWSGLTGSFRRFGSSLAGKEYLVGLADIFEGQTANTQADAKKLRANRAACPRIENWALISPLCLIWRVQKGPGLVSSGFPWGGHWAVWLSQRPQYNVAATILYYAARAGDFSHCKAGILAHFAETDPWVSKASRKNMERAIRKSGCNYDAFDYPRTQHWFAESDRASEFDADAAAVAMERDLRHLKQQLKA